MPTRAEEVASMEGIAVADASVILLAEAAIDLLYDLIDEGMNLHPKGYSQVQRRLRELGD